MDRFMRLEREERGASAVREGASDDLYFLGRDKRRCDTTQEGGDLHEMIMRRSCCICIPLRYMSKSEEDKIF